MTKTILYLAGIQGCGVLSCSSIIENLLRELYGEDMILIQPKWSKASCMNQKTFKEAEFIAGMQDMKEKLVFFGETYPTGENASKLEDLRDLVRNAMLARQKGWRFLVIDLRRDIFNTIANPSLIEKDKLHQHTEVIRQVHQYLELSLSTLRSLGFPVETIWYEEIEGTDSVAESLEKLLGDEVNRKLAEDIISKLFSRSNKNYRKLLAPISRHVMETTWPEIRRYEYPRHPNPVVVRWNAGLFSCFSVCLHEAIFQSSKLNRVPNLKFHIGARHYSNDGKTSVYDDLCEKSNVGIDQIKGIEFIRGNLHIYKKKDPVKKISPLIKAWFSPKEEVLRISEKLIEKYNLNPEKTLCCYLRSTDKKIETKIPEADLFGMRVIEEFQTGNYERVLIQSDQTQVIDSISDLCEQNGIPFTVISENRSTTSEKGIHQITENHNKIDSAKTFFATVLIMSKCKGIIYSTSNVSRWISLFRGNYENTHQFHNGKFH